MEQEQYFFKYSYVNLHPTEQIDMHQHQLWELSYIITGSGTRVVGQTVASFSAGDLVLLPPNIPHCWKFDEGETNGNGDIENITILFSNQVIDRLADAFPKELAEILQPLRNLREALTFSALDNKTLAQTLLVMRLQSPAEQLISFFQLLVQMAHSKDSQVVGRQEVIDQDQLLMDSIQTYISCNAHRSVTIEQIAKHVGMNRQRFCEEIKRLTGRTFVTYLNEYRIEQVCISIREKRYKSVAEAAYHAGFNDVSYFHRLFRNIKGMTPGDYAATVEQ